MDTSDNFDSSCRVCMYVNNTCLLITPLNLREHSHTYIYITNNSRVCYYTTITARLIGYKFFHAHTPKKCFGFKLVHVSRNVSNRYAILISDIYASHPFKCHVLFLLSRQQLPCERCINIYMDNSSVACQATNILGRIV